MAFVTLSIAHVHTQRCFSLRSCGISQRFFFPPHLIPAGDMRNKAVCQAVFLSKAECDQPSQWRAFKLAAWGISQQTCPQCNSKRAALIELAWRGRFAGAKASLGSEASWNVLLTEQIVKRVLILLGRSGGIGLALSLWRRAVSAAGRGFCPEILHRVAALFPQHSAFLAEDTGLEWELS